MSQGLQVATAAIDAAVLCVFVAFSVLDNEDGVPTITAFPSHRMMFLNLGNQSFKQINKLMEKRCQQ